MIPMGQSSDNCHLANERIRKSNLIRGKNVIRHLLEEVGAAAASNGMPVDDAALQSATLHGGALQGALSPPEPPVLPAANGVN